MKIAFDPQVVYHDIESKKDNHPHKNDRKALKQLCEDFESIFIHSLFKEMRKTIPDEGYLEHEMGMEFFQEIMDMEVAREMSRRGGMGLGQLLYEQLQQHLDKDKQ